MENKTAENEKTEESRWWCIRVTYNRELKVKAELETLGIRYFLPMVYQESIIKGRKVKKLVPAIHNLIFIHCTRAEMIDYKERTALPVRYIMNKETRRPEIIPDRQMENFIAVAGNYDEQIVYLDYDTAILKRGERVRITGGIFSGVEGEFVRIAGDRRVVVTIRGIAAIATAFIHPSLIQKLDK